MKKILICLYYYEPYVSWLTIYAKNLAEWLVKKWHEVTIYCSQHDKVLPLKEEINWVKVIREKVLCSFWKWVIIPKFFIKASIMSKKFDVVNFHLPNADLWLASLFINKNKLIITYHCDINLWKWLINNFIQKISFILMNIALNKTKYIVWNSKKYFENSYFKKYINKFVQIYPPINFEWIDKWNEKIDITENSDIYKIWFLWRIVYEKWINFLLEAILDKSLSEKNIHLYIWWDFKNVRWWSVMWELTDLIEKTKDRVTFLWNIDKDQLKDFYSKIDVLVLPSIDPLESFWMVQVESMFNNTPVIASNMPWVSEVVEKTWFWLLSIPKSSKDLAKQILKMINSKENYKNFKWENILKNKVLTEFSFEKTLLDYENLMR